MKRKRNYKTLRFLVMPTRMSVFHAFTLMTLFSRLREEEEAMRQMEEARRLAEEMQRKQYELEMRLRFNRSLQLESTGLSHTQDITRAFVFSLL